MTKYLVVRCSFNCRNFRQCLLVFFASQMAQQVNFWHDLKMYKYELNHHYTTIHRNISTHFLYNFISPPRYKEYRTFSYRMAWQQGPRLVWNGVTHRRPIEDAQGTISLTHSYRLKKVFTHFINTNSNSTNLFFYLFQHLLVSSSRFRLLNILRRRKPFSSDSVE